MKVLVAGGTEFIGSRVVELLTANGHSSGIFRVTLSPGSYVQYVTTDLLFDNGKARRMLNWAPEFTLSRGVEEMAREYLEKRKRPRQEGE